jgi:hypothetical protein
MRQYLRLQDATDDVSQVSASPVQADQKTETIPPFSAQNITVRKKSGAHKNRQFKVKQRKERQHKEKETTPYFISDATSGQTGDTGDQAELC